MEIAPIAVYRCPLSGKFGLPRQSGVVPGLEGEIVFLPPFDNPDALRGMEGFSHIWAIWGFSEAVKEGETFRPTVRPPRLGGNERMGVFATRSPFRPNHLGLSCLKVVEIILQGEDCPRIKVSGADLMDGTPIYDVKPYIPYADSIPEAKEGFTSGEWSRLEVNFPDSLKEDFSGDDIDTICSLLAEDPRPHYHEDPERSYALSYKGKDIVFKVNGKSLSVINVREIRKDAE